jgi:FemAB-related protein (PEP-CTERM system-associated)
MNAPFVPVRGPISTPVRPANLRDPDERGEIERFVRAHPEGTPFHLPAWLEAVEQGTGNRAMVLVAERGGELAGLLPLNEIHSPIFGRLLASTGFAVDGGMLLGEGEDGAQLLAAAERLALSHSCPTIELRGGPASDAREGWALRTQSHCGFVLPLAADDEAQLTAVPRKQRAEVRKSLANDFQIEVGTRPELRDEHYAVYAESVRNLGTPVFPRALFDAVVERFGDAVDILTVRHEGRAVASVLSLYWRGAVMPYWGGGTWDARRLRANDRMYYELMLHARRRGCDRFDFGRSKTNSGAYHFKRNWGFTPEPLSYAVWTAPGCDKRDADPTSAKHKLQISLWQKLPLPVANRIGPWIARGLG